jgi:hypothetical protein
VADSVRVDTGALGGAGGDTGAVAHAAVPQADQVQPCALDCVSVAASSRFSAAVSLARRYTAMANATARSYGVMLQASAAAYDGQEAAAAAMLGAKGGGAMPAPPVMPAGAVDTAAGLLDGGGVTVPGGEVPAAPRDIARLIETGRAGVGIRAWLAVETSLRTEAAALVPGPGEPVPPPAATPQSPGAQHVNGPVDAPVTKPDPAAAAAPQDHPVQPGPGEGESLRGGGPTWPPADVHPTHFGSPLLETVTGTGAAAVPQLVPGIIGGIVGGVGGVMGNLAGTGAKALQGVQQAVAPVMSGLGQHPGGGGGTSGGGESAPDAAPESLGEPGGADLGGAGSGPTAPASDGGAMSAPTPMAAAPAAAAPVSAAAAVPAAPAGPAPAVGAMGPMLPPLGGGRGSGSGPQNKQLYQDRKLKVVAPPNSEPVKNRREGRDKERDRERERDRPRG